MRRSSSLIGGKLWRTSVVVLLGGNGRLKAPFLLAVTAKNLPFALPPNCSCETPSRQVPESQPAANTASQPGPVSQQPAH